MGRTEEEMSQMEWGIRRYEEGVQRMEERRREEYASPKDHFQPRLLERRQ